MLGESTAPSGLSARRHETIPSALVRGELTVRKAPESPSRAAGRGDGRGDMKTVSPQTFFGTRETLRAHIVRGASPLRRSAARCPRSRASRGPVGRRTRRRGRRATLAALRSVTRSNFAVHRWTRHRAHRSFRRCRAVTTPHMGAECSRRFAMRAARWRACVRGTSRAPATRSCAPSSRSSSAPSPRRKRRSLSSRHRTRSRPET